MATPRRVHFTTAWDQSGGREEGEKGKRVRDPETGRQEVERGGASATKQVQSSCTEIPSPRLPAYRSPGQFCILVACCGCDFAMNLTLPRPPPSLSLARWRLLKHECWHRS